jgi:hypothetical protein
MRRHPSWRIVDRVLATAVALGLAACAEGSGDVDAGQTTIDGSSQDAPPGIDGTTSGEVCDGQDNDGDQFVDEGAPQDLCGPVANGTPKCNGLAGCSIDACSAGFMDVDGMYSTGCECGFEEGEAGSVICEEGRDLGEITDDNKEMIVTGNLVPVGDVDFYRFRATDLADTTCDSFHVRVLLLDDPNGEFLVEVWRGGCAGTQICGGGTDFQWYTNFRDANNPPTGQCPCTTPQAAVVGTNVCTDDSSDFVVRVSRAPGKPLTCNSYKLEISNGKYAAP